MNNGESPSSFFDAETGAMPEPSLYTTPVVNAVDTPTTGNTPIHQRRLFPGSNDQENDDDDNNHNNNNRFASIRRHNNLSVDVDLEVVEQEAKEDNDCDSNCSATEVAELNSSTKAAAQERLEVIFKLEDNIEEHIQDHQHNGVFYSGCLPDDVRIAKPPTDWVPKAPNTTVGEPEFIDVDNPGMQYADFKG